ncbi:phage holin family protein [Sphingobium ummariense]
MTDDAADPAMPQAEALDESVRDTLARLYSDGRAYASAEMDRQRLRAGILGTGVRDAAVLALVALILLFSAIVALLVGLILTLEGSIGPLWATLAVVGGTLLVTLVLLLLAKARIERMKKAITP